MIEEWEMPIYRERNGSTPFDKLRAGKLTINGFI
jgi:hypothetical protein